jgi:hypothetical protein
MRREIITLPGGGVAAWPFVVRAQRSKMERIAIVSQTAKIGEMSVSGSNRFCRAFFEELNRLGYVEGRSGTNSCRGTSIIAARTDGLS